MRLAPTLVLSSLAGVLVPLVHAHGSFHTSPSRSLARLQHHESRALIDVCVTIPSLVLDVASLIGANLKLCLCIKDLDIYLKTHADVTLQNNAIAEANAAINADGRRKTCGKLPAHAHRACTTADPCAFECDTPYIRQGDQCKCKIAGCGASPTARSLKSRRSTITNWKDAKAICGSLAVCGVKGKPEGWECLDVTDSCGGCPADHPFLPKSGPLPKSEVPPGTDCHKIPHSKNVRCEQGKCVVQECQESYTVSSARDKCIPHHSHRDLITLGGAHAAGSNPMVSSLAAIMLSVKLLANSTGSVDVTPVLDSITKLLGSVLDLRVNLNVTITLATSLQSTLTQCGCDPTLLAIVNNLLSSLLSLLDVCRNGVPPIDGTDSCLTVDVSHVVCSLLPGVCIDPIFVCGSLGKSLHNLLQPLLNTLGVGVLPATACPKCIATLPSGAVTLPSAVSTPPTVPSAVATPPTAPSTAVAHPSDPNTVINIAGITIDLALHIGTVAANLDPACGDLIAALNDLVTPILRQPLTGPDGLLAGVLRRGLVVDLNLNLGGGGSTGANALNSSLQNAHDAVKNAPDSCKAGGLGPLLDNLLGQVVTAVNNLLNGLLGCGCGDAVAGAIAAAQKKAISASPAITPLVSRAVSPSDSTDKLIGKAKVVLGLSLHINLAGGNMPFAKSFVEQLNAEGINPLLTTCVGDDLLRLSDKGTLGGAVAAVLGGGKALSVDEMKKLVETALRLVENAQGNKSCGCNRAADQLTQGLNELAKAYGEFLDASKKCGDKGPALVAHVSGLMSQSNIKAFQLLNS